MRLVFRTSVQQLDFANKAYQNLVCPVWLKDSFRISIAKQIRTLYITIRTSYTYDKIVATANNTLDKWFHKSINLCRFFHDCFELIFYMKIKSTNINHSSNSHTKKTKTASHLTKENR